MLHRVSDAEAHLYKESRMEVMLQCPNGFSSNLKKKKKLLPLSQLAEDMRGTGVVSHHLLETRVYSKLKRNAVVEAEPPELHFSGFEVGKDYKRVVKLINISSEVLDVHILPTQTKYFRTEYTKKSRLVPGLCYTITVHFSPNEWRYFFDSVRIHCMGEENLLVPVHAYPVIDDLHIPSHVSLRSVSLGHSTSHVIPLSCSCPVDFEFQVHCLQSHDDFTIQPLSGIIPANGKTDFTVTFTPRQYGSAEITLQLVISQFNSKPFICTLTASCSPHLTLRQPKSNEEGDEMFAKDQKAVSLPAAHRHKFKAASTTEKHIKKKMKSDQYLQTPAVDVSTPADLAKMLIQPQDKTTYKDLRESMFQTKTAHQTRRLREASFENQARINVQKERANHLRRQVHLGEDLISTEQKMKHLKEQQFAAAEYKKKKDNIKLSSQRSLRDAGQVQDCIPDFSIHGGNQLKVRQRMLRLFQQAVRKVIQRCRMNRLRLLQEQVRGEQYKDEKVQILKLSSEKLLPFMLPVFSPANYKDELAVDRLGHVHVSPFKGDLTAIVPFFSLKVPQYYKLLGYQEVSVYAAGASFVHPELRRPLRIGAQDELWPAVEVYDELQEEQGSKQTFNTTLTFSAPRNILHPLIGHPLRIFNPAPGVHAFQRTPHYLESDLEFHLCPLPKYTVSKGSVVGVYSPSTQKKFLDRKDIIKGITIWKKFPSMALTVFSCTLTRTSNWSPRMSDPFSSSLLPLEAPPALHDLPDDMREEIFSGVAEYTGVNLTPEMVQAGIERSKNSSSKPLKKDSPEDDRATHEQLLESTLKSQRTQLGLKVLARMKYIKSLQKNSSALHDYK